MSSNHTIVSFPFVTTVGLGLLSNPCQIPLLKGSRAYRVNPGAKPIEAAIRSGKIAWEERHKQDMSPTNLETSVPLTCISYLP